MRSGFSIKLFSAEVLLNFTHSLTRLTPLTHSPHIMHSTQEYLQLKPVSCVLPIYTKLNNEFCSHMTLPASSRLWQHLQDHNHVI